MRAREHSAASRHLYDTGEEHGEEVYARPAETPKPTKASPAAKPAAKAAAAPAPAQAQTKPQGPKAQAARVARARATQRARAANLINPKNYSYVRNDLKLIAGLAIAMFAVIIILHFTLPA